MVEVVAMVTVAAMVSVPVLDIVAAATSMMAARSMVIVNTTHASMTERVLQPPSKSMSRSSKGKTTINGLELSLCVSPSHTRIVDLGASDHMTDESTLFSSYSPYAGKLLPSNSSSGGEYKEDESSLIFDLTFEPEVETETIGDNVETKIDSEKNGNVETDLRFGKNLVYTRKKNIPESTHIQESNHTLHEVTSPDPSSTNDSIFEFSHE
ncbi:hypothetical protein KIW84_074012 [Lathyrus oleraceus]|uniref:Uncharacterized protein n=1 Tax=Pisum sativum TaxID=3888 RepID=A0A9D4VR29_PEA|nr:hypothetical protein KIW84_074012 [Pisum sativum]